MKRPLSRDECTGYGFYFESSLMMLIGKLPGSVSSAAKTKNGKDLASNNS